MPALKRQFGFSGSPEDGPKPTFNLYMSFSPFLSINVENFCFSRLGKCFELSINCGLRTQFIGISDTIPKGKQRACDSRRERNRCSGAGWNALSGPGIMLANHSAKKRIFRRGHPWNSEDTIIYQRGMQEYDLSIISRPAALVALLDRSTRMDGSTRPT